MYLVECVYLFSIGCKGHETRCQVNQAANHHVLLAEAGLLIADQVPSPHHVTVTVLHTAKKEQIIFLNIAVKHCNMRLVKTDLHHTIFNIHNIRIFLCLSTVCP